MSPSSARDRRWCRRRWARRRWPAVGRFAQAWRLRSTLAHLSTTSATIPRSRRRQCRRFAILTGEDRQQLVYCRSRRRWPYGAPAALQIAQCHREPVNLLLGPLQLVAYSVGLLG